MLSIRSLSARRTDDGISLTAEVYLPTAAYEVVARRAFSSTKRVETIYLRANPVERFAPGVPSKREVTIDIPGTFTKTVLVKIAGAKKAQRVQIES